MEDGYNNAHLMKPRRIIVENDATISGPLKLLSTNDAGESTSATIADTLAQRGTRYGSFSGHAKLSQDLKYVLAQRGFYEGTDKFTSIHRESMDMILHKIARIVNGDPNYDDNWRDIAGYAQLVVDNINGKDT